MEATSEFFRKHPRLKLDTLSADKLIASAMSYKLTRKMLNQMDDERNLEVREHHLLCLRRCMCTEPIVLR